MACKVLVTDEARGNLESAVAYVADALAQPNAAASILIDFDAMVDRLASFPEMFPTSSEPRLAMLGFRKASFNSYVALYKVAGECVVIGHVFHQTQDYANLV